MSYLNKFRFALLDKGFKKSVLVTSSFRSGSSVICGLLRQNRLGSLWHEKLAVDWKNQYITEKDFEEYFARILDGIEPPLFTTKIMWPHRNNFVRINGLKALDTSEFISAFPKPKWIHIYREDVFSQAISFWKAKKTNIWHVYNQAHLDVENHAYSFEELLTALREIIMHDRLWREFYKFAGINPMFISYEKFFADTEDELKRVLLEVTGELAEEIFTISRQYQQRNKNSESLREQFMYDLFAMGH